MNNDLIAKVKECSTVSMRPARSKLVGEFLFSDRNLYTPSRSVPSERAVVEYHPDFGIEGIGSILGITYLDTLSQIEPRIGDQLESMLRAKRTEFYFDGMDITFYLRIYCFPRQGFPRQGKSTGMLEVRETFSGMALEAGKYFVDVAAETY